jgi:hypothetical protein
MNYTIVYFVKNRFFPVILRFNHIQSAFTVLCSLVLSGRKCCLSRGLWPDYRIYVDLLQQ